MTIPPPANRPPPLVDHLNRPLDTSLLTRQLGAPSFSTMRTVYTSTISRDMRPAKLAGILRAAESGDILSYLELAEQMEEKDLHYLSVLGTRRRAVTQLDISVEDADASPEAKACGDLVRDWIKRETLQPELFDILDAIGKGFSMTEVVWETSARQWSPASIIWTDPRFFRLDLVDLKTPLLYGDDGEAQPVPPFKFIQHVHPAKSGLAIRSGLARPVAWAWMFKNYTVKDWVAFAEVYGMPLRVGKYGPGATDDERATLLRAVQSLGSDAAGIIPNSMSIEFVESRSGQSDGTLFKGAADFFDQQVSKAVLGQTATTDAISGGHAVGREHQLVRDDIKQADAVLLQATLNRDLVQPFVMLNRGPQAAYPRIRIKSPEWVDVQALSGAIAQLAPYGFRVKQSELRSKFGLTDPEPTDEVLEPPTPTAPPGAAPPQLVPRLDGKDPVEDALAPASAGSGPRGSGSGARSPSLTLSGGSTAKPNVDAVDELSALALSDWEPLADALAKPMDELVAKASSLTEIRDGLASLIGELDIEAMADLLARAGFASRVAGLVGADIGDQEQR